MGSGLFRDVLEGSFPELYAPPAPEPEPEAAAESEEPEGGKEGGEEGGTEGSKEDAGAVEGEEGAGAIADDAEPDEYQRRITDIASQVRPCVRLTGTPPSPL